MAKTILSETGCGFTDGGKSGKLWKRYMETLRVVQRDAIPFYSRDLADADQKSGEEAGYACSKLNTHLYGLNANGTPKKPRTKKKKYETVDLSKADGEEEKSEVTSTGGAAPTTTMEAASSSEDPAGAGVGNTGAAPPPQGKGDAAGVEGSTAVEAATQKPKDSADEGGAGNNATTLDPPSGWLRNMLLVFALYGKFSQAPDLDMDLTPANGQSGRKGNAVKSDSSSELCPGAGRSNCKGHGFGERTPEQARHGERNCEGSDARVEQQRSQ